MQSVRRSLTFSWAPFCRTIWVRRVAERSFGRRTLVCVCVFCARNVVARHLPDLSCSESENRVKCAHPLTLALCWRKSCGRCVRTMHAQNIERYNYSDLMVRVSV